MCKHWGLHISTNINRLSAILCSFWEVWKGLLWCLKAKLRSWWFPRYWRFNKQYHGGYQLICLISWPLLITSKRDWYRSKGLLKGFKLALRPWESSKNWWRYDRMKFVTTAKSLFIFLFLFFILFYFLLPWTYYTRRSAEKYHVTSVIVTSYWHHMTGHMISVGK